MRTINNISKRINRLTTENFSVNKRIINFNNSIEALWVGSKRYAH
ncbi:hypothetical protein [Yeosuana aromativorans]|nr:hypothetical protein [Yeosuana aromativorans]